MSIWQSAFVFICVCVCVRFKYKIQSYEKIFYFCEYLGLSFSIRIIKHLTFKISILNSVIPFNNR